MAHWLKTVDGQGNEEVAASRHDKRAAYLEHYLVHEMRKKSAKCTNTTSKRTAASKRKHVENHFWTKEVMDKKLDLAKAEHLRASGKIKWQKCAITGSEHPDHIEWIVPKTWQTEITSDDTEARIDVENGALGGNHVCD